MQPTQVYETLIFDRDSDTSISFVSIPVRSLAIEAFLVDDVFKETVLESVGFEPRRWISGDEEGASERLREAIEEILAYPGHVSRRKPGARPPPRSEFAKYLAYEAPIPVEQSSVAGNRLTEMLPGGGLAVGGLVHGDALIILIGLGVSLGGIILIRPADTLGEWLDTQLRNLLDLPARDDAE